MSPVGCAVSEYITHFSFERCNTDFFRHLAPPVLSDVVEAVNYFREVRCFVQECLEVLHRVFLHEIQ